MAAHACPATDPVRRLIGNVLLLMMIPQAVESAVIEVTAGGAVEEPTYLFTESDVVAANLTARNGTIKASGDLETGSGNRVDDLASRLAAAEATIASLQTALSAKLDATTAASTYQPILAGGSVESGRVYNRAWYVTAGAVFNALSYCSCTPTDYGAGDAFGS